MAFKCSICDLENNNWEFKLFSMLKLRTNFSQHWNIAPMEKALWPQWNISPWFVAPV